MNSWWKMETGNKTLYICLYLMLCLQLEGVTGLLCYSCYGSGGSSKCSHSDEYIRSRDGDGDPSLVKNCTSPFDVICYKEVYMPNGTLLSDIRDCGDGKTFTFSAMTGYDYSNLTNHPNDNQTVCAGDQAHTFCLTKCTTDFCNGPQLNRSTTCAANTLLLIIVLLFNKFYYVLL